MMQLHRIFFYSLIVLLPTQLGFHFWPAWSYVLGRRLDYLSPTLYLTDMLIISMIISWFMSSFHRFTYYLSLITYRLTKNKSVSTLLLSLIVVNILVSTNKQVSIYGWLKITELCLVGFYIYRVKPNYFLTVLSLSIASMYSSVLAVVQFILQRSVGGWVWWLGERTFSVDTSGIARINLCDVGLSPCVEILRPYATFPHPNVLAGFLVVLLPLFLPFILSPKRFPFKKIFSQKILNERVLKYWWIIVLIMMLMALAVSFSRSAWIAGALVIAVYLRSVKDGIIQKVTFKPVAITVLLLLAATYVILPNISFLFQSESFFARVQLNQVALQMFFRSPLFGIGFNNFLVLLPSSLPSKIVYFLQPVHNIYLLLLAETGLVGLLFFVYILWSVFKKIFSTLREKNELGFSLVLSLLSLILLGILDHYWMTLQQGRLMLVIIILLPYLSHIL